MADLPISGLPNLTASTNNSLIAVVASGVTYNINLLDLWKSAEPFGTMYQDWIPDAPSAHTIGSVALPIKSIYVSTGSVFIGPNNSLAIDDSGVLYSTNVFAAPTFQVGNVTSGGGIVTTSGVTFSVVNNEMLMISNSGGTITNLTRQPVPTGGTINQVLTQTGNTNYEWGWVSYSGGTSGTSGSSGSSGSSGTSGSSGSSGTKYPYIGYRLKQGYKSVTSQYSSLSILNTSNDNYLVTIEFNPTLSVTPSWTDIPNSPFQYSVYNGTVTTTITSPGHIMSSLIGESGTSALTTLLELSQILAGLA